MKSRIICFSEEDGVGIMQLCSGELVMFIVDMHQHDRHVCCECGKDWNLGNICYQCQDFLYPTPADALGL